VRRLLILVLLVACRPARGDAPRDLAPQIERIPGTHDAKVMFRAREPGLGVQSMMGEGRPSNVEPLLPAAGGWYERTYRVRSDLRVSYRIMRAGKQIAESELVLPDAPAQPWNAARPGVARGQLTDLAVAGRATSSVYTPAGYDAKRTYSLLVIFDREIYTSNEYIPGPTILDNLIADHRIPPMIAVFVGQGAERTRELANDPAFLAYVADQLLPAVRARWSATADPRQTVVAGSSAGGLASSFFALRRPDVFGNVLSQSGAYWRGDSFDSSEREWLTKQYAASPRLPVRFVVQVGILERWPTSGNGPPILDCNRRLRAVLERKGYELHYQEIAGGHEPPSWRGGLADGLIALFGIKSR
jgi:enterochelin esterase-like enzyme